MFDYRRSRRSAIWNVFTETHKADFIATCNICSHDFSYRTTTTNLFRHLEKKHPGVRVDVNYVRQKPKEAPLPESNENSSEILTDQQPQQECEAEPLKVETLLINENNCNIVVSPGKTKSAIWDHFAKLPDSDSVASCNYCHKELSYKTTIFNLKRHLGRKHAERMTEADESTCKLIVYNSDEEMPSDNEKECDTSTEEKGLNNDNEKSSISEVLNSRRYVSPVWKYFTKLSPSDFIASCNICNKQLSYKTTTTNLQRHVERKHPQYSLVDESQNSLKLNSEQKNYLLSVSANDESFEWNYFTKDPNYEFTASCNLCDKKISYSTTTQDLKKHLEKKHGDQLAKMSQKLMEEFNYPGQSILNDQSDEEQQQPSKLQSNENQEDNDFWNQDNDSDEDTDFRASPAFVDMIDVKNTSSVKLRSKVWNAFTKKPMSDGVAICKVCNLEFSYRTTTNNLKKHFEKKHPSLTYETPLDSNTKTTDVIDRLNVKQEDKKYVDNEDVDSSDGAVFHNRRRRSQIWNFFARKSSGELVAICKICRKELSFRSTISDLKKHLEKKHPNIGIKMENEVDEKMNIFQQLDELSNHSFIIVQIDQPEQQSEDMEESINLEFIEDHKKNNNHIWNEDNDPEDEDIDFGVMAETINKSTRRLTSKIWNVFTKKPMSDGIAICKFCNLEFSYRATTNNLRKHLEKKHPFVRLNDPLDQTAKEISQELCDELQQQSEEMPEKYTKLEFDENHQEDLIENEDKNSDDENIDFRAIADTINRSTRRLTSKIWNFFTKKPMSDGIAICRVCNLEFSYRTTTNNLRKHLEKKHPFVRLNDPLDPSAKEIPRELNEENDASNLQSDEPQQQSEEISKESTKLEPDDENYEEVDDNSEDNEIDFRDMVEINKPARKNTSKIWNVFIKKPMSNGIAICRVCHLEFSYRTTTNNLRKHFVKKHSFLPFTDFLDSSAKEIPQEPESGELQHQAEEMLKESTKLEPDENPEENQNGISNEDNNSDDEDVDFRDSVEMINISTRKNTSKIWNAFTKKPMSDGIAICKVCNLEFSYRTTIYNLKKHFEKKHPFWSYCDPLDSSIKEITHEGNDPEQSLLNIQFQEQQSEEMLEKSTQSECNENHQENDEDYEDVDMTETVDSRNKSPRRLTSKIWNVFTKKPKSDGIAICRVCNLEFSYRATTNNLRKHLEKKHPFVCLNDPIEPSAKNVPDILKTCLICLQTDQTESKEFVAIKHSDSQEKDYLTKIQEIMNLTMAIDESHVLCTTCVDEIEKILKFRENVLKSLEFWSKTDAEPEPEAYDNSAEAFNDSDYSEAEEGESSAKYSCSKCNKEYPSSSSLMKHTCGLSTNKEPKQSESVPKFTCNKCHKVFSSSSDVASHNCGQQLTKERKKETDRFCCERCGRSFNMKSKLNSHLKICQRDVSQQFVCSLCGKIFKKAYHLREHMAAHTGEHNYSCKLCGKTFQRQSSKYRHMRSHNAKPGEKSKKTPFLCTICGKSFPYSNGASRHMRVHLGIKRHQCHICLRRFMEAAHLKVHIRTHTGERPYGCMICGRAFSLNATLRKHMRLHVGSGEYVRVVNNADTYV